MKNKTVEGMRKCALAAALSVAFSPYLDAGIIQTLPAPSDDGWYELGATTRTSDSFPYAAFDQVGYIAWDKLREAGLPADAKIRFVQGVLLDALPAGYTYDFSQLKYLAYIKADVFPAGYTLTIPDGCWLRFRGANISCDYDAGTFTLTENSTEQAKGYLCNIVLNGKMRARDSGGAPTIHGTLSGTGKFSIMNFWHTQTFAGDFNFDGELLGESSQGGDVFVIKSTLANSFLRKWTADAAMSGQYLAFLPDLATPCVLAVDTIDTGYGNVSASPESCRVTAGAGLFVHSGNTVNVGRLMNKDLVVVADETATNPKFEHGIGNVVITNFGETASGSIYVSPNVNLTVGFHNDVSRNFVVDYRVWTNLNNVCTLDISSHNEWGSVGICGLEPFNLPRRIVAPTAKTNDVSIVISRSEWYLPFSFDSANASDPCPACCESNGILSMPANGTVRIADLSSSDDPLYPGKWTEYPVMTCCGGGEAAFSGWNVEFCGLWKGCQKEAVVKDTGLYVRVRKQTGLILSFY